MVNIKEELLKQMPEERRYPGMVSIPPGWEELVADCHKKLIAIDPDYVLLQVKEKFGGLRYYISSFEVPIVQLQPILRKYESLSYHICENCSRYAKERDIGGWINTLCEECYAKRLQKS